MRHSAPAVLIAICAMACQHGQPRTAVMPDALTVQSRTMLLNMSSAKFAEVVAQFDATMATALPQESLASTWRTLVEQAGPFVRIHQTRTEVAHEYRIVVLTAAFERASLDVRIAFDSSGHVAGLNFVPARAQVAAGPPPYADPSQFTERSVTVSDKWQLPGTVTLPKRSGQVPGIVLVHGSGPQDEDESAGGVAPFRDLAWGLASRGIAVLRYEKRTRAHPAAVLNSMDSLTVWDETIDDAVDAESLLKHLPEVDSSRVFVLGHSLGGMLAPRIAMRGQHVAGLVIMAAPARPLEDVILEQVTRAARMDSTAALQASLADLQLQVTRVKDSHLSSATPRTDLPLGLPATYWLDLRGYSPPEAARDTRLPLLILEAGGDTQVSAVDRNIWGAALRDEPGVRFRLYPDLDHLFVGGKSSASGQIHIPQRVIDDIATWVQSMSRPASS